MPRNSHMVLEVQDLCTELSSNDGTAHLVHDVTFDVRQGEILGIVGETGSGKSMTAHSILRLVRSPIHVSRGRVYFRGDDLLQKTEEELRAIRGKEIGVIFQNPRAALHPMIRVRDQIGNVYRAHHKVSQREAWGRAIEMLAATQIPNPERVAEMFPHELSGGMAQRVTIAMALVCSPSLVIADEPTTGLDVTVQLQILKLLRGLLDKHNAAAILITHDLGIVANFCQRVIVFYGGRVMESGNVEEVFESPKHPYTLGLLASATVELRRQHPQLRLKGSAPNPLSPPSGCIFHPRCPLAYEMCRSQEPPLVQVSPGRQSRCHLAHDL